MQPPILFARAKCGLETQKCFFPLLLAGFFLSWTVLPTLSLKKRPFCAKISLAKKDVKFLVLRTTKAINKRTLQFFCIFCIQIFPSCVNPDLMLSPVPHSPEKKKVGHVITTLITGTPPSPLLPSPPLTHTHTQKALSTFCVSPAPQAPAKIPCVCIPNQQGCNPQWKQPARIPCVLHTQPKRLQSTMEATSKDTMCAYPTNKDAVQNGKLTTTPPPSKDTMCTYTQPTRVQCTMETQWGCTQRTRTLHVWHRIARSVDAR